MNLKLDVNFYTLSVSQYQVEVLKREIPDKDGSKELANMGGTERYRCKVISETVQSLELKVKKK